MKFEVILFLVAVGSVLFIVLLSDWGKRTNAKAARRQGRAVAKSDRNHNTDWNFVAVLVIGFLLYALLLQFPDLRESLRNRDYGALDPIFQWLLKSPLDR